jgi:hypothetical protein
MAQQSTGGEPVEQGRGYLGVATEHGRPFGKTQVGRDEHRGPGVELADQVKEQLAATLGKRQVTELVEHSKVGIMMRDRASRRRTPLAR